MKTEEKRLIDVAAVRGHLEGLAIDESGQQAAIFEPQFAKFLANLKRGQKDATVWKVTQWAIRDEKKFDILVTTRAVSTRQRVLEGQTILSTLSMVVTFYTAGETLDSMQPEANDPKVSNMQEEQPSTPSGVEAERKITLKSLRPEYEAIIQRAMDLPSKKRGRIGKELERWIRDQADFIIWMPWHDENIREIIGNFEGPP